MSSGLMASSTVAGDGVSLAMQSRNDPELSDVTLLITIQEEIEFRLFIGRCLKAGERKRCVAGEHVGGISIIDLQHAAFT